MAPPPSAPAKGVEASWAGTGRPARVSEAIRRSRPRLLPAAELAEEPDDGVEVVGHPLLHGDDAIVGDVDMLGADLAAALGDVAEPDPRLLADELRAVDGVERMHVQAGDLDEESRSRERLLQIVVADHVADVLAQEALDALVELLD